MKKTTIVIDGTPFTYVDEIDDIKYDTISAISEDDARSLLQTTKDLFDKCGIRFYLIFGTLLGAVRDHGLIEGDEDVDVYIDSEQLLRRNLPFLHENGLKVCRIYDHRLYSFHTDNNSYIDVYIRGKLPFSIWGLWCDRISLGVIPRCYIKKYDKIDFLGIECLCPHKPERVLRYWYGKSWRTPIKGHYFTYDSPSRHWWRTQIKPRINSFSWTIEYICKSFCSHPRLFLKKVWNKLMSIF
jgi:hypothetical protein